MTGSLTSRAAAYDHAAFLRPLAALSAALGRDLTQVQGPGGNTSLKQDGVLWVKASGTDLAEAESRCIFTAVALDAARAAIRAGDERPPAPQGMAEAVRPSIEWSLHALMPHAVVLHTHDVDVIAWAVREDAEAALERPLRGLAWAFVPYARPGLPLTLAARDVPAAREADILVLGNHGLVVGGGTAEEAARRLTEVRGRLALAPRPPMPPRREALAALAEGTRFAPAALPEAHFAALDPAALAVAAGGVLYPDHAVFLGPETAVITADTFDRLHDTGARLVLVPGAGALVDKGLTGAAQAMAACLGLVASRFSGDARPAYLDTEDISALLGWDAERYRQELARRKTASGQG